VILLEPERTQFDLRWRMFGIPVRVHPLFWLVAFLLGTPYLEAPFGVQYLLLWVACMFFSILVHELGHIVAGIAFGSRGQIVLYGMGGLAIGSNELAKRWQRIAVSFAGPAAGLLLFGAVYLVRAQVEPGLNEIDHKFWIVALWMLFWMNLIWNLLNLLPIWPLDGGQITRELCTAVAPSRGVQIALGISFLLAALLAVHFLMAAYGKPLPFLAWFNYGSTFSAVLFGLLAVENLMMLQQINAQRRPGEDERSPWERDPWR
jgi:Zn-dependent protease